MSNTLQDYWIYYLLLLEVKVQNISGAVVLECTDTNKKYQR